MPHAVSSGALARHAAAVAVLALLAGCASVTPGSSGEPSPASLDQTIGTRVPSQTGGLHGNPDEAAVAAKLEDLLRAPLGLQDAVQIGLLNGPKLQAIYAELDIARLDVVEAGLLSNPTLDVRVRPTFNPAALANLEFGLVQGFIDLLVRPARKRMAAAVYEESRLRLAGEVVAYVSDVQTAYFDLQAALNAQQVLAEIAESASASADLAERFHAAGNISDLRWKQELAASEDVALAVIKQEQDVSDARESLAALLGLGVQRAWTVPDILPAPPAKDETVGELETVALERRLDVAAARQTLHVALIALKNKTDWRLWKELNIGIGADRDSDGQWAVGPEFQVPLPLFNQGRPEVARAAAAVQKAQNDVKAAEIRARTDVRRAAARLATSRKRIDRYAGIVLPLKRDIVALKQQEYNYMFIGAFEVLLAKKEETSAYLAYIESVHAYWRSRADLDRVLGGGSAAAPVAAVAGGAP